MFAKKLAVLAGSALALTAASTAFADHRDYRDGWRARHHYDRAVVYHRPYYVARPAYYAPRAYYHQPAYTYYEPSYTYYAPTPAYGTVYYGGHGAATVGGAVVGAVIGNQISDRRHRGAATAAGALVGAFVGSRLEYGY